MRPSTLSAVQPQLSRSANHISLILEGQRSLAVRGPSTLFGSFVGLQNGGSQRALGSAARLQKRPARPQSSDDYRDWDQRPQKDKEWEREAMASSRPRDPLRHHPRSSSAQHGGMTSRRHSLPVSQVVLETCAKWERSILTDFKDSGLPDAEFEYRDERDGLRMIAKGLSSRLLDLEKMPKGLYWDSEALAALSTFAAKLATTRGSRASLASSGSGSAAAAEAAEANRLYLLKARVLFSLYRCVQQAIVAAERHGCLYTKEGAHNLAILAWAYGKAASHSRMLWAKDRLGYERGSPDSLMELRQQSLSELFPWFTHLFTGIVPASDPSSDPLLPPKKAALSLWSMSMIYSYGAHPKAVQAAARAAQQQQAALARQQEEEEEEDHHPQRQHQHQHQHHEDAFLPPPSIRDQLATVPIADAFNQFFSVVRGRFVVATTATAGAEGVAVGAEGTTTATAAAASEQDELLAFSSAGALGFAELALISDALRLSGREDRSLMMAVGSRAAELIMRSSSSSDPSSSLLSPSAVRDIKNLHATWAHEKLKELTNALGEAAAAREEGQAGQAEGEWLQSAASAASRAKAAEIEASLRLPLWETTMLTGAEEDGWWMVRPETIAAAAMEREAGQILLSTSSASASSSEGDKPAEEESTSAAPPSSSSSSAPTSNNDNDGNMSSPSLKRPQLPLYRNNPQQQAHHDLRSLVVRVNEAPILFQPPSDWMAVGLGLGGGNSSYYHHSNGSLPSLSSSHAFSAGGGGGSDAAVVVDAEFPHEAPALSATTSNGKSPAASTGGITAGEIAAIQAAAFPPRTAASRSSVDLDLDLRLSSKEIVKVALTMAAQHAWHGPFFALFKRIYGRLNLKEGTAAPGGAGSADGNGRGGAPLTKDVLLVNSALRHLSPFPHLALGSFTSIAVKAGASSSLSSLSSPSSSSSSSRGGGGFQEENIYAKVYRLGNNSNGDVGFSASSSSTGTSGGVGRVAPPASVILVRDPVGQILRVPTAIPPRRLSEALKQSLKRVLSSPSSSSSDAADEAFAQEQHQGQQHLLELLGGEPVEGLTLTEEVIRPRRGKQMTATPLDDGAGLDLSEGSSSSSGSTDGGVEGTGTYSLLEFAWPEAKVALKIVPQDKFRPDGVDCVTLLDNYCCTSSGWRVVMLPYFEFPSAQAPNDPSAVEKLDSLVRDALTSLVVVGGGSGGSAGNTIASVNSGSSVSATNVGTGKMLSATAAEGAMEAEGEPEPELEASAVQAVEEELELELNTTQLVSEALSSTAAASDVVSTPLMPPLPASAPAPAPAPKAQPQPQAARGDEGTSAPSTAAIKAADKKNSTQQQRRQEEAHHEASASSSSTPVSTKPAQAEAHSPPAVATPASAPSPTQGRKKTSKAKTAMAAAAAEEAVAPVSPAVPPPAVAVVALEVKEVPSAPSAPPLASTLDTAIEQEEKEALSTSDELALSSSSLEVDGDVIASADAAGEPAMGDVVAAAITTTTEQSKRGKRRKSLSPQEVTSLRRQEEFAIQARTGNGPQVVLGGLRRRTLARLDRCIALMKGAGSGDASDSSSKSAARAAFLVDAVATLREATAAMQQASAHLLRIASSGGLTQEGKSTVVGLGLALSHAALWSRCNLDALLAALGPEVALKLRQQLRQQQEQQEPSHPPSTAATPVTAASLGLDEGKLEPVALGLWAALEQNRFHVERVLSRARSERRHLKQVAGIDTPAEPAEPAEPPSKAVPSLDAGLLLSAYSNESFALPPPLASSPPQEALSIVLDGHDDGYALSRRRPSETSQRPSTKPLPPPTRAKRTNSEWRAYWLDRIKKNRVPWTKEEWRTYWVEKHTKDHMEWAAEKASKRREKREKQREAKKQTKEEEEGTKVSELA